MFMVFERVIQNGLMPNVKNCNRVLRILRDKESGKQAKDVYKMIGNSGIKPTVDLAREINFVTLSNNFCYSQ